MSSSAFMRRTAGFARLSPTRTTIAALFGTTALFLVAGHGTAQSQTANLDTCALVDGTLRADCANGNAGTIVVRDHVPNVENDAVAPLGADGFAISIEPTPTAAADAGDASGTERSVDRALDAAGISVTLDGLDVRPRLAIATDDLKTTTRAGDRVIFRASSNYPAWLSSAEVRIVDRADARRVIATVPIAPNGSAGWPIPSDGPDQMLFSLRVYDPQGRYNETRLLPLTRSTKALAAPELSDGIVAAAEGEDMTSRSAIPIRGGAVTVSGVAGDAARVVVMGEEVPVDGDGRYAVQRILPSGAHSLDVQVGATRVLRDVEVPGQEWFAVGLADITFGKRSDEPDPYSLGRFAGYTKGRTASGYTITASVDTREGELEDVFRDLNEKNPDRILNRIASDDVYPTFGDDSTTFDDAPTSGKFFFRVEKDGSYLTWGDFQPEKGPMDLVRSDRTLYGAKGYYQSPSLTSFGEPRVKATAYAADPDRLAQRDILFGTGGSAYFLSRQDLLAGTETVYVEYRDSVTGHVIDRRRLTYGSDYDINYFQGVIILQKPLAPNGGGTFLSGGATGRYDQALVVQYEYVPTIGNVDGYSFGGRAEGWLGDRLQVGVSGSKDTTGLADNQILGADIRLRKSENTYLQFDYARSEGPGYGFDTSFDGGLDLLNGGNAASAGVRGLSANAYRLEGQADLAELSDGRASGTLSGYYDRKEAGFVSADFDIPADEESIGIAADVNLGPQSRLHFSHDQINIAGGKENRETRLVFAHDLNNRVTVEVGASDLDRDEPLAYAGYNGARTDLGAKLIWTRDSDMKLWAFGQGTVRSSGGINANNRAGVGAEIAISDRMSLAAEVSAGNLGAATDLSLNWDNGHGRTYHVGYRLDPERTRDLQPLIGDDNGGWVMGSTAQVTDKLSYTTENRIDLKGPNGSLTNAYGVRYSPTDKWSYALDLTYGEDEDPAWDVLTRYGIGGSATYTDGDQESYGLKFEYVNESSANNTIGRDTWLVSGFASYRTSRDWRFLSNVDVLASNSDQSSFRDGRYVEAEFGYAYRPAEDNRLTALLKYSYLYDMPGPDQVNYDGNLNGPGQKTHVLSADVNYDLTPRWTVGVKYGYRFGTIDDRFTSATQTTRADLGIIRFDYSVALKWDAMIEARLFREHVTDVRERAVLAAVYRSLGDNLKIGAGYQWGDVSDDLKSLDHDSSGIFVNVVGKF